MFTIPSNEKNNFQQWKYVEMLINKHYKSKIKLWWRKICTADGMQTMNRKIISSQDKSKSSKILAMITRGTLKKAQFGMNFFPLTKAVVFNLTTFQSDKYFLHSQRFCPQRTVWRQIFIHINVFFADPSGNANISELIFLVGLNWPNFWQLPPKQNKRLKNVQK